ncbi:MAG TPA: hypothetical protein VKF59_14360 [Candidatus Dormibacteraeota bacterium]|nr:hypothetical protein [Candidatus Dormibacteraeota bacterium]
MVVRPAVDGVPGVATSKSSPQQQSGTPTSSHVRVVRITYPQPGH